MSGKSAPDLVHLFCEDETNLEDMQNTLAPARYMDGGKTMWKKFWTEEDGATAIEYGLIAALVSVAAITALSTMGDSLETMFNTVSTEINNASTGSGTGSGA